MEATIRTKDDLIIDIAIDLGYLQEPLALAEGEAEIYFKNVGLEPPELNVWSLGESETTHIVRGDLVMLSDSAAVQVYDVISNYILGTDGRYLTVEPNEEVTYLGHVGDKVTHFGEEFTITWCHGTDVTLSRSNVSYATENTKIFWTLGKIHHAS